VSPLTPGQVRRKKGPLVPIGVLLIGVLPIGVLPIGVPIGVDCRRRLEPAWFSQNGHTLCYAYVRSLHQPSLHINIATPNPCFVLHVDVHTFVAIELENTLVHDRNSKLFACQKKSEERQWARKFKQTLRGVMRPLNSSSDDRYNPSDQG
jgi:hypothetical protein